MNPCRRPSECHKHEIDCRVRLLQRFCKPACKHAACMQIAGRMQAACNICMYASIQQRKQNSCSKQAIGTNSHRESQSIDAHHRSHVKQQWQQTVTVPFNCLYLRSQRQAQPERESIHANLWQPSNWAGVWRITNVCKVFFMICGKGCFHMFWGLFDVLDMTPRLWCLWAIYRGWADRVTQAGVGPKSVHQCLVFEEFVRLAKLLKTAEGWLRNPEFVWRWCNIIPCALVLGFFRFWRQHWMRIEFWFDWN